MTSLADFPRYNLPDGQVAIGAHVNSNGHTVIASGEKLRGTAGGITFGGVLLTSAGLLLLALAIAMGVVSWHAQYAFIYAIKHQRLAASLEALGLDCGAVVFSILGIALARLGRRAVIERALVCICAAGSCAMNAAGADLGSPRSVAAFVMPPLLFAITSDRLISVIRRSALGRLADDEAQRSAWRMAGAAFLYVLRFAIAPVSTGRGARQALLNATPLPDLPTPADRAVILGTAGDGSTVTVPQHGAIVMGPPRSGKPRQSRKRAAGPTKTHRLLTLAAERHDLAAVPLAEVSSIATGIAGEVDLHPGTARRILLGHVRELQNGGQS